LPSAVAAKKTREFRCPPVEQMKSILGFKNLEVDDEDNRPCGENLITQLTEMHESLMVKICLDGVQDEEAAEVISWSCNSSNWIASVSIYKSTGGRSWSRKVRSGNKGYQYA